MDSLKTRLAAWCMGAWLSEVRRNPAAPSFLKHEQTVSVFEKAATRETFGEASFEIERLFRILSAASEAAFMFPKKTQVYASADLRTCARFLDHASDAFQIMATHLAGSSANNADTDPRHVRREFRPMKFECC